jgi:hypothetical protein
MTLPAGWAQAGDVPRVPGLELDPAVAAGPRGAAPGIVAGRLTGLQGSIHPAAVAERIDARPPQPGRVALGEFEGLRWTGLEGRDGGRLTLFVVPTSAGTLAAACPEPAAPQCGPAAASLTLEGAGPSSIAAATRFADRLDSILAGLSRRRAALGKRLRSAGLSGGQAQAAAELARAHRSARAALERAAAPPAAEEAAARLGAALQRLERAYTRLAAAARRRSREAFRRSTGAVRRADAGLARSLRET